MPECATPELFVIMGPSGCGKSTVGKALAQRLGMPFVESDDHHPPSNRDKMARGDPLDDADRVAWLDNILGAVSAVPGSSVLACSALTEYVQQRLVQECRKTVIFCLLELDRTTLELRVKGRANHFMPAGLVASQLAELNAPSSALCLAGDRPVRTLVRAIITQSGRCCE